MKIGIIGGGVGGLTFACCLLTAFKDSETLSIEIFEQAGVLEAVGAGVTIGPKVLSRLPDRVASLICQQGTSLMDSTVFTLDGTHAYSGGWPQSPIDNGFGVSILRSDLQNILLSEVAYAKSISFHLGCRAVQYTRFDNSASVLFDNGERRRFDLLVVCDGIWSSSAAIINPGQQLEEHGSMALRAIVNHRALEGTKHEIRSLTHLWVGSEENFLCYPVGGGEKMYVTAYTKWDANICAYRNFNSSTMEYYQSVFSGADPRIAALLDLVHAGEVRAVISRTAPTRLSSGRIVALGDSVGAMCSHSAQGANTAMLSAIVLSRILADLRGDWSVLDSAISKYGEQMLKVIVETQVYARRIADIYHDGSFSNLKDKVEKIRHTILTAPGVPSTLALWFEG